MRPSFFLQIIEILFLLSLVAFKDSEILTFHHVMCHHKVELRPPHFQLPRVKTCLSLVIIILFMVWAPPSHIIREANSNVSPSDYICL